MNAAAVSCTDPRQIPFCPADIQMLNAQITGGFYGLLPATELGLGIMREEDDCDAYGKGPSGE